MKFLDIARVHLRSGAGGGGCIAFRREKFVEFGGPSGGDGGKGGDVWVEAVDGLNTLIDYRYQQHFFAKNGQPGSGSQRTGKSADDVVLKVPAGTEILEEDGETLVGLPTAGKSTFLAAVSNAHPKIADYPFTTLHPGLGVVAVDGKEFVLADIPGLIEGAHEGKGLGDSFLAHVERCAVLLHLVDATSETLVEDYRVIVDELEAYGGGLADKPRLVGLNKLDALDEEETEAAAAALEAEGAIPLMRLSGATGQGVQDVLRALRSRIEAARDAAGPVAEPEAWRP